MTPLLLALGLAIAANAPVDTLRLGDLQARALANDPRARQAGLRAEAAALRLANIDAEGLPQLTARSQASYQSEVAGIPISLPNLEVLQPPKARYEVALAVEQRLLDPTVRPRRELERAQLTAEIALLRNTLYPLATEVNEAFFAALLLQNRRMEVSVLVEDLRARLALVRSQAREGAALPGDTAIVLAELLRIGQEAARLEADHTAAVEVLARLTGAPITTDAVLDLPTYGSSAAGDVPRVHPQYAVHIARLSQLSSQAEVISARARPQVAAFAEVGYGRPGPKQFTDDPHEYWSAGVRVRWAPWSWGTTGRERDLLEVERRIVETEESAFEARLDRAVRDELATIQRLRASVASDNVIIALREQVERQARAQLEERAITPAAYIDARGELQTARLAKQGHLVELAAAEARYRTTLGLPLR